VIDVHENAVAGFQAQGLRGLKASVQSCLIRMRIFCAAHPA